MLDWVRKGLETFWVWGLLPPRASNVKCILKKNNYKRKFVFAIHKKTL